MDDCIDLFYILLPRILFAIPEKNFSAHISCGRHERFAAARLQSIFPYCNQPIFNQQLTLTEDRNYILLRCFCRARLLRLQPYFFSRTVLFEPADHIGCKPHATTHLLRVVLQRSLLSAIAPFPPSTAFFRLLHTEDHSYAMCSVVLPTFNLPPPPTPSWQPGLGYAPAAGAPPQKSSGKSSPRRLPFHLVVQLPFAL